MGTVDVLDCANLDSAIQSLAGLFGASESEFREKILKLEINFDHDTLPPEAQIHAGLGFDDYTRLPVANRTKWFHGTRAQSGADFAEGLLPTREAFEHLLPTLGAIAKQWISEGDWFDYVSGLDSSDRQYARIVRKKRRQTIDRGPFAFLVRDLVVTADSMPQKPYQERGSEILELVCWDFEEVFGRPLLEKYLQSTRSCLVVFAEPKCEPHYVRAALTYVYYALHDLGFSIQCNTNFDGQGVPVPPEWIDRIEWL